MDQSEAGNFAGCATGLTMKEYDEQLRNLTAENIHLKLKVYFMDTQISKMDSIQDKDLMKENIDLKISNESQAKELREKNKLILEACEAFQKLKVNADELAERVKQGDEEKKVFEAKIEALETIVERSAQFNQMAIELSHCKTKINDLEEQLEVETRNVAKLTSELEKRDGDLWQKEHLIRVLEECNGGTSAAIEEPSSHIHESSVIIAENRKLKDEISTLRTDLTALEGKLAASLNDKETLKKQYTKACDALKGCVNMAKAERIEKENLEKLLKNKDASIEELTGCLKSLKSRNNQLLILLDSQCDACNKGVADAIRRISDLSEEANDFIGIEDDSAIHEVSGDITGKTSNAQQLMKKELLDKDKEIMKLGKLLDEERVANGKKTESLATTLKEMNEEKLKLREREQLLRLACTTLISRLEELACFLESLLADEPLGALDKKRHKIIQEVVERSRELSRTLTMSFNDSAMGDGNSIGDQSQIICKLREQMSILTEQVRQRDIELEHCQGDRTYRKRDDSTFLSIPSDLEQYLKLDSSDEPSDTKEERKKSSAKIHSKTPEKVNSRQRLMDASESEAWSEPDRQVSLARMGHLESVSVTPLRLSKCDDSSDSAEETLNDSPRVSGKRTRSIDSDTRKLQSKVKQLEDSNRSLKTQLTILEKKQSILSKLGGESTPRYLLDIQQGFTELEEYRESSNNMRKELVATRGELSIVKEDLLAKEEQCSQLKISLSDLESKIEELTLDYELRLLEAANEKTAAESRTANVEEQLKEAELLRKALELKVEEIDKKVAASNKFKAETSAKVRQANDCIDTAERLLKDVQQEKIDAEKKVAELEGMVECLKAQLIEKTNDFDALALRASREREEASELKRRLLEAERSKLAVEVKVKEARDQIHWIEGKLRELEEAMDQCNREAQTKIEEEVQKGVASKITELAEDWVSRVELDNARRAIDELENQLESQKASLKDKFRAKEEELLRRIYRLEIDKRDIQRQMDEIRVLNSKMESELTRLCKDKIQLEEDLQEKVDKHSKQLSSYRKTEETLLARIRNLEKVDEDAMSTLNEFAWARAFNTSPDLGIDSDHGRFSSLENQESKISFSGKLSDSAVTQLEEENIELKRRLTTLEHTLERTMAELSAANQCKKQMERAVCKQLHMTHHILKNARMNFEMQESDSVE